jgi:hypothetical protein
MYTTKQKKEEKKFMKQKFYNHTFYLSFHDVYEIKFATTFGDESEAERILRKYKRQRVDN